MKYTILILVFAMLAIFSCHKAEPTNKGQVAEKTTSYFNDSGTITGQSMLMNDCSGLYFIKLKNDTLYTFDALPSSTGINLATATFPVHILLNWHTGRPCHEIIIDTAIAY